MGNKVFSWEPLWTRSWAGHQNHISSRTNWWTSCAVMGHPFCKWDMDLPLWIVTWNIFINFTKQLKQSTLLRLKSFSDLSLEECWASLVRQWLRIRLPMQGTWVRALVREDSTCHGATKPVHHNYWACVPQLLKPASLRSATREATAMRSPRTATKSSPYSPQLEKARTQQRRPNAAKNK